MAVSLPVVTVPMSVSMLCAVAVLCALNTAQAQTQVVKPAKVQLWMDVSTGGIAGLPEMEIPSPPAHYGDARSLHVTPPRIVDIALWNSHKPGVEAAQQIPTGMRMGESLPLVPLKQEQSAGREPGEYSNDHEPPKGRLLMYWGCGESVRPGQPRVVDFTPLSSGNMQAFGTAFSGRYAADRGARIKPGYDVYPNEREQKTLPKDGSLVGDHRIVGEGIPASFKFSLAGPQDVMPAIDLQSRGSLQDSIALTWGRVANARAYYLYAMATQGDDVILWSSSESSDSGMGLFDYLSNTSIKRWTREKILLGADVTRCTIPKGILAGQAGTAFVRMMAYGGEHNLAYPPRSINPKTPWEPEWSVRLRVKSHTMAMLGQEPSNRPQGTGAATPENQTAPEEAAKPRSTLPVNPVNLFRGLFGG